MVSIPLWIAKAQPSDEKIVNKLDPYRFLTRPHASIYGGVAQNVNATLNDRIIHRFTGRASDDPAPINIGANTLVFGINVGVATLWR
jgi:hypothetical protein